LKTTVPVLVIFRGGTGALGMARTLGRLGVPMYMVMEEGISSPVLSSRFWKEKVAWDFSRPASETLQFLADEGGRLEERYGSQPILLTVTDWVAAFIEDNAAALSDRFLFPRSPTPTVRPLLDKWQMFHLAREHGIPTPETVRPDSRAEVEAFLETAKFPVVMKATDPFMDFVPKKAIVDNRDELFAKFDSDMKSGPPNIILQEFIPGTVADVWMCNAYFGDNSECHAVFPGRKLRQTSPTGIACLSVCEPNEIVAEQTRSFMQAVGYRGCVGIGWRFDARDGSYQALDVNARVSGAFRLFVATNGMDVVRICYLDLTNQPIPASELSAGRKWWIEEDLLAASRAIRDGSLTLWEWIRSLRGVREAAWFAIDDIKPFFAWLSNAMRRIRGRFA
jgi:D-aspartate ligase